MSEPGTVPVPRIGVFGGLFNPPHVGHQSSNTATGWPVALDRYPAMAIADVDPARATSKAWDGSNDLLGDRRVDIYGS